MTEMIDGYTAQKIKDFWMTNTPFFPAIQGGSKMNFGEICKHQQLKRKCVYCEFEETIEAKNAVIKDFREALEKIADEDYRGNRPQSAVTAFKVLSKHPKEQ